MSGQGAANYRRTSRPFLLAFCRSGLQRRISVARRVYRLSCFLPIQSLLSSSFYLTGPSLFDPASNQISPTAAFRPPQDNVKISNPQQFFTGYLIRFKPTTMSGASLSSSIVRKAPLVFPSIGRHTATVIFIHGLGDTGHGWSDAVNMWRNRERLREIKFILPHAPDIPVTMNMGMRMPGWFDIRTIDKDANEDLSGVLLSREYFNGLVQQEINAGIPADRIVIGGFSQGGAMSIFTGLTSPVKLGGIVGLSSWLLFNKNFESHLPDGNINKDTPIFMGHGDQDPLVGYNLAQESEKALKEMGFDVKLKTYRGMPHSACLEEFMDVSKFLEERLRLKGDAE